MLRKLSTCLTFISIYTLSGIVFWGEHTYMLPTILVSSFIISFLIGNKTINKKRDFYLLNIPFILILFLTCLIGNNFSVGLPYLIFTPIISLLGFWAFRTQKKLISISLLFLILIIAYFFQINYFSFYHNNKAEKNIPFPKVEFIDKEGKSFVINQNKIVILDFWSTNCGICFKKFPELEKIYLEYKNNPNIEIYAVNVPLKNDNFNKTKKILDSIGYTFPKIYAKSAKEIDDLLKIHSFPHLLIIKNGIIRYDGMFETNKDVLVYNTKDEIEKLEKEKE